jgi:hypothetical protein
MLETVLEDEPHLRDLLYVECVELVTGGPNWRALVARLVGRKPTRERARS